MVSFAPLLFLSRKDKSMREKQILGEEIRGEIVELVIISTHMIRRGNSTHAGYFVHILEIIR